MSCKDRKLNYVSAEQFFRKLSSEKKTELQAKAKKTCHFRKMLKRLFGKKEKIFQQFSFLVHKLTEVSSKYHLYFVGVFSRMSVNSFMQKIKLGTGVVIFIFLNPEIQFVVVRGVTFSSRKLVARLAITSVLLKFSKQKWL